MSQEVTNREAFLGRLAARLAEVDHEAECTTVLVASVDDLRAVHDAFGHTEGDRALSDIERRLQDLAGTSAAVSRLDGDEFALLVPGSRAEHARQFAAEVAEAVHRPVQIDHDRTLRLCASIGVCLPTPTATAETMLRDARTALSVARTRGHTLVEIFQPAMREAVVDRLQTSTDLADALDAGSGLILHFQPVVDLRGGLLVAAEALVRWRHPTRGLVPPNDFIGVAEATGLIAPLGRWVLDTAVGQLAAWLRYVSPEFRVHVNLSPWEFQHPGLVDSIAASLERHHVRPSSLLLEITETGLTGGVESMDVLGELEDLGVGLGIDDFGTGYSSISYLRELPVDTVKLDRSLISGVASSPPEYALTRAILELIDSTGLRVVAEGIESAVQVAHLRALNCRYGQGFHLARPAAAEQMTTRLRGASAS